MISETMPLNEWPLIMLKHLQFDLEVVLMNQGPNKSDATLLIWGAVNQAIKDVEFEQSKLPFK